MQAVQYVCNLSMMAVQLHVACSSRSTQAQALQLTNLVFLSVVASKVNSFINGNEIGQFSKELNYTPVYMYGPPLPACLSTSRAVLS